nr:MAG TPA: hypothetical protein [Caudoviricetes sp.]DAO01594.1 MAG TPA: hypothetical protein [Caudoviricetes sp.]DAP51717.1 MAG TPA: hypothetical protein [Caudoviricetes sp.]DAX99084.1 MAG TPA: hypothetical protein [Caudoviricetes sp.]
MNISLAKILYFVNTTKLFYLKVLFIVKNII